MPGRKTVSIEIGPERVRAAVLADGRKDIGVSAVVDFDIPDGCVDNGYVTDPRKLAAALSSELNRAGVKAVNAVFSIISDDILVGGASVQRVRKKDLDAAVREKAQEIFGLEGPRKDNKKKDNKDTESSKDNSEGENESETGEEKSLSADEEEVSEEGRADTEPSDTEREIDAEYGSSIDDYYTAYKIQEDSEESDELNVVIYAAPSDLIDSYNKLADMAGLTMQAADYSGNSLFQWMRAAFGHEAVMMLDLRRTGSTVTIMTDGSMRVQADLESRTEDLVDAIREREEQAEMEDFADDDMEGSVYGESRISKAGEPVVRETEAILSEFLDENDEEYIDRIVIAAEGEGVILLANEIQKATGINTQTLEDLPKGLMVSDETPFGDRDLGDYVGIIGAILDPLDFRSADGKSAFTARTHKNLITKIMIIVIIVCIIVTAALCVTYFLLRSHHNTLNDNLNKVKYTEDIYKQYKKAETKNSELKRLDDSTQQRNDILSQLFSELESKMPSDSKITSMNSEDDLVTFSVSAGSKESAAQFIEQLRKIDYLSDISVSELTDSSGNPVASPSIVTGNAAAGSSDSTGNNDDTGNVQFTVSAALTADASNDDSENADGANDDGLSDRSSGASGDSGSGDNGQSGTDNGNSDNSSNGSTGQTVSYIADIAENQ